MIRPFVCASILCLGLSPAVFPLAAQADPRVLTDWELAAVTAGGTIVPLMQINVNETVQIARATATSSAVCSGCINSTVTAFSEATAFNSNAAELTNLAF